MHMSASASTLLIVSSFKMSSFRKEIMLNSPIRLRKDSDRQEYFFSNFSDLSIKDNSSILSE